MIQIEVCGSYFPLAAEDIAKHPNSLFAAQVTDGAESLKYDRNAELFCIIHAYMINNCLPRDQDGSIALQPGTVAELKEEAIYFGLNNLVEELSDVDAQDHSTIRFPDLQTYHQMKPVIQAIKEKHSWSDKNGAAFDTEWGPTSVMVNALTTFRNATSEKKPTNHCIRGELTAVDLPHDVLYGASTVASIRVAELLAAAEVSPFGRGTATVIDPSVRRFYELRAYQLNTSVLTALQRVLEPQIAPLMDDQALQLRPYKLVIYQEGGHFDQHRDTVRGEGHIGTLVLILNSAYTGGELEITHGSRTEVVTGPFHWVAMYGDCLDKINLVTSGTPVSLIYDVYAAPHVAKRNGKASAHAAVQADRVVCAAVRAELKSYGAPVPGRAVDAVLPEGARSHPV